MNYPVTASFYCNEDLSEFDKNFKSVKHLRDYCDYELGFVTLESFSYNDPQFESLEDFDHYVKNERNEAFKTSGFTTRAEFDE